MSSWTPQQLQQPQLAASPRGSSGRSNDRCQSLHGSRQDPWWSLTEPHHRPDSDDHNLPAASTSCVSTYNNYSPPWPLPLEDFLLLDEIQFPLASTASASPEELSVGPSPAFLEQNQQHQLYDGLLLQHCQELLNSSSSSVTPALSALDDPDMTYLSLFGGVGTEPGLDHNGTSSRYIHRSQLIRKHLYIC